MRKLEFYVDKIPCPALYACKWQDCVPAKSGWHSDNDWITFASKHKTCAGIKCRESVGSLSRARISFLALPMISCMILQSSFNFYNVWCYPYIKSEY